MIGVGTAAAQAVTHPKTTRNLLIVAAVIVLVVPVALVAVPVTMVLAMGANGVRRRRRSVRRVSTPVAAPARTVDGYGPDQLKIAATIITVGQQMNVPAHGQALALMVAIGESGLRNLDHGDAVDNTTIGVFQQGAGYGGPDAADGPGDRGRRVLHTDAAASRTGRPSRRPSSRTQSRSTPTRTTTPRSGHRPTRVAALTGASHRHLPGARRRPRRRRDTRRGRSQARKLNFLEPRYEQQVINMADGTATPDCAIDAHVLQLIVVAVQAFQQVGVSDLNRRCTGMTPGAGTASAHWKGKAVDFYALNRRSSPAPTTCRSSSSTCWTLTPRTGPARAKRLPRPAPTCHSGCW